MQTPSTPWIWITEQIGPLALIAVLLIFIIAVLSISARRHRSRMNQSRAGINETTFVNYLSAYGFDARIAKTTYEYLQEKQRVSFPIAASDLLDEDLGLDSVDVNESVRDLMQINGRVLQLGIVNTPITTVEDLVRFIQASPRLSEMVAA